MNNEHYVGKILNSRMPYFNAVSKSIQYKARPVLVLYAEKAQGASDFTVLPISSISNKINVNAVYDLPLDSRIYPNLCLKRPISYVRTGKIHTLHSSNLLQQIISD